MTVSSMTKNHIMNSVFQNFLAKDFKILLKIVYIFPVSGHYVYVTANRRYCLINVHNKIPRVIYTVAIMAIKVDISTTIAKLLINLH